MIHQNKQFTTILNWTVAVVARCNNLMKLMVVTDYHGSQDSHMHDFKFMMLSLGLTFPRNMVILGEGGDPILLGFLKIQTTGGIDKGLKIMQITCKNTH